MGSKIKWSARMRVYFSSASPVDDINREYQMFRRCLPQLIDNQSMTGDLTGKWIIFANGWLYDFSGFDTAEGAVRWAEHLFQNDTTPWIVVNVNLADHALSPLEMLGNAIADVEMPEDD